MHKIGVSPTATPIFSQVPTDSYPFPYCHPYQVGLRIAHKDDRVTWQAVKFLQNHIKN